MSCHAQVEFTLDASCVLSVVFIEISEAGSQCCHHNTDNIEVMTQIVMIFRGVAEKLLIEMELCFDKYVVRGVLYHT